MSDFREYDQYDGLGLAELVHKGEVQPLELVEAAINRIEAINPQINAVVLRLYDRAREAAQAPLSEGPFKGVPILLKDLGPSLAGTPTTAGSRFLHSHVPDHDSELVHRYKAAGLIVLGKTNVPEFGIMPVTENALYGPCKNPWDLSRNAGGSSGGSAAAVATRMVPIAHGNDGGGSIRIPASCCGVFGFKPTRARVPAGPDADDVWYGLAVDHVLTRSVRDSAAMLDATAGPDVGMAYCAPPPERPFLQEVGAKPGQLRIAYTTEPFFGDPIHPDCITGLERTVHLCKLLGHEVVEAAPTFDVQATKTAFYDMARAETRAALLDMAQVLGREPKPEELEPNTWAAYLMGKQVDGSQLSLAVRQLRRTSRQIGPFFEHFHVFLTPTLGGPPWRLGALRPNLVERLGLRLLGRLRASRLLSWLASQGGAQPGQGQA